jgi:hypothetical protein
MLRLRSVTVDRRFLLLRLRLLVLLQLPLMVLGDLVAHVATGDRTRHGAMGKVAGDTPAKAPFRQPLASAGIGAVKIASASAAHLSSVFIWPNPSCSCPGPVIPNWSIACLIADFPSEAPAMMPMNADGVLRGRTMYRR